MRTHIRWVATGLAFSALLAATPVAAQNPGNESTPAERAQTRALNNQIRQNNAAAEAQYKAQLDANNAKAAADNARYRAQQQQYQKQLQQNRAAQTDYDARNRAYRDMRSHYARERAAYRRAVWPSRYSGWRLASDAHLVGDRVEIINGQRVGTVSYVVRAPGDRSIEALAVQLDNGPEVWIDEADVRFNRTNGVIVTNLDRGDLFRMADLRR